jgi:hypothetical protein
LANNSGKLKTDPRVGIKPTNMKSMFQKILFVLCACISLTAFAQQERSATLVNNDPDWQVILNNNIDFLNRLLGQEQTLSDIWSGGKDNFLSMLSYSAYEYNQKVVETKAAAQRLLQKYPELNTVGCDVCRTSETQLINRTDNFIDYLKYTRTYDAGSFFREIDLEADEEGDAGYGNPKCGWRFYACIAICAASIEFFPAYLACCVICLCDYCKNPPKWCR